MALLPALFLLIGSIILAFWRPAGRRGPWLVETAAGLAGLAAALPLAGQVPWAAEITIWPSGLLAAGDLGFRLTEPGWMILTAALSLVVVGSLHRRLRRPDEPAAPRSAWLLFGASANLAILAANLLTVVVAWSLLVLMERWLWRAGTTSGDANVIPFAPGMMDMAAVLLLLAAAGSPSVSRERAWLLLAASGARAWAALSRRGGGEVLGFGSATAFFRACLSVATVLAMLTWGPGAGADAGLADVIGLVGAGLLLAGAISLSLGPRSDSRGPAWILALTGAGLVAGNVASESVAPALAAGAATMSIGAVLLLGSSKAGAVGRVASGLGMLTMVGLPLTAGGVLLAALVPPAAGDDLVLGWLGVLGLGLGGARFLEDLATRSKAAAGESRAGWTTAVGIGWMAVLSLWFYLEAGVPMSGPSSVAIGAASAVLVAGAVAMRVLGMDRRDRLGRSVRLPNLNVWGPAASVAGRGVQSLLRVGRDIMEGDAAVLWSFVALLAVMLLVRASG